MVPSGNKVKCHSSVNHFTKNSLSWSPSSKMSYWININVYYAKIKFYSEWHRLHGHCLKNVQIWSFLWSVFFRIRPEYGDLLRKSPYLVRIQENTDQKRLRIWTLFIQWEISYIEILYTKSFTHHGISYETTFKIPGQFQFPVNVWLHMFQWYM